MVMGKPEARRASEGAERSSEVAGKASGAAEELQKELGGTHNGGEKKHTKCLYAHNFLTNLTRKSRLVRFGQVLKFLQNLTNRDSLA